MLHTIRKRLEICIGINIELNKSDHYAWISTTSYSHKVENLKVGRRVLIRAGGSGVSENSCKFKKVCN